jgi:predicted metalloprotease
MLRAAVIALLIVLFAVAALLMCNPAQLQRSVDDIFGLPGQRRAEPQNDDLTRFVRHVLADTEDTWGRVFEAAGRRYVPPTMVLFTGGTQSACGTVVSAKGPLYCPLDQKIYLDLSFFDELERRFHAPGDFAKAYVIALEVGHHVQKLLGVMCGRRPCVKC